MVVGAAAFVIVETDATRLHACDGVVQSAVFFSNFRASFPLSLPHPNPFWQLATLLEGISQRLGLRQAQCEQSLVLSEGKLFYVVFGPDEHRSLARPGF